MAKINASDVSEKAKAKLRPTAIMGGTTSHNGKPDTDAMVKKSQAHHEANRAKRSTSDGYMSSTKKFEKEHPVVGSPSGNYVLKGHTYYKK